MPEAGACTNCPKRTGFNTLLFSDVRKDSCTDPACFQAKLDAHVAADLGGQTQAGADIVGMERARRSAARTQPLCGIGGQANQAQRQRRQTLPGAETLREDDRGHRDGRRQARPDRQGLHRSQLPGASSRASLSTEAGAERAEESKRIEQEKLAITIRHRILSAVLAKVAAPLKKSDLLPVANYVVAHLPNAQVQTLAKRHKVEAEKNSASLESLLAKRIASYDEAGLCRTLLEVSLLDSAYQRGSHGPNDPLLDAAKRYRIDTAKIEKVVAQQVAAQQEKRQSRKTAAKKKAAA